MRWFSRRRKTGKHALGAAVTAIPSALPKPVVTAVAVPPAGTAAHAVPLPRTAAQVHPVLAPAHRPTQPADRSAVTATRSQPTTAPTAYAPEPSALEHALVDLLLQEQAFERPSLVAAQPPLTAGVETSPLAQVLAPPPAAAAVAPPTVPPTSVVVPSVQLGFRDGSTVELDPRSPHARSLQTLARALTTLD